MTRERGPILTWLIGSLFLGSLLGIALAFFEWRSLVRRAALDVDDYDYSRAKKLILVVLFANVLQAASVIGIGTWKRWAVATYFGLNIVALFAFWQEAHQVPIRPLVTLGLLLMAVVPRWSQFE